MPDGETLLDHGIHRELAMEVIAFARERDLHVQAYRDDKLLVERDRPEAHEYSEHGGMQINIVANLDDAMGPTTPKLVIVAKSATLEQLLPEVRSRWAGRLNAATSMPIYLEFTSLESAGGGGRRRRRPERRLDARVGGARCCGRGFAAGSPGRRRQDNPRSGQRWNQAAR
jgi:hypothetical protein